MKFLQFGTSAICVLVVSACMPPVDLSGDGAAPTTLNYTAPDLSGLNAIGPYPNSDDVCQLLAPNRFTDPVRTKGRDLIACPKHEKGAIADRRGKGARLVAYAKHWTILSVRAASQ